MRSSYSCACSWSLFCRGSCQLPLQRQLTLRLNHSAANTLNLRMMSEHMHVSVASAKKCAQQPADDRNDDRTEKCAPETWNLKTRHDLTDKFQHQRINN